MPYVKWKLAAITENIYWTDPVISADQPLEDICQIAYQNVAQSQQKCEKRTARAILVGPPGSGKRTISRMLNEKWGMLSVDVQTAIDTGRA